MQYLTWFLPFLTCKVLVAVNLKLLATNTHRRLSISDSLAELLVLIDLEKEMAKRKRKEKKENLARVSGGLPRIQSQRGTTRRPGPESFLPSGCGPGRSPRARGG